MPAASKPVRNRMQLWETDWAYMDPCAVHFNVKITDRGRIMLNARGITPVDGSEARVQEFLSLERNKLSALAISD